MELKVDLPSLSGQNIDPATFQRVWDRVMPGQPTVQESTSIPDTSVPAIPTQPLEETPPVETPPVEQPPVAPDLPPVPDCPAEPVCPECPSNPDRPEEPPVPGSPTFCLSEASQGDSGRLEELMTLACTGAVAGRAAARRAGSSCSKVLSALACDHRSAFRRLSAAYFLITGRRYTPKCTAPSLPVSLPLTLRQQFLWEQQWELKNKQAAQATSDPCLKELYLELAQEGSFHAGTIRSLLEQMG